MAHNYTAEERAFIERNYFGITTSELTDKLNAHFGADFKRNQIKSYLTNHHLSNGVVRRFKKNHVPANKGKKMSAEVYAKAKATMFQKGHSPHNHRPVGSERLDRDGYRYVKIAEPNKWRMKHVLEWERVHGPVPHGHKLLFIDQNRNNTCIDNLVLVSAAQMAVLNKNKILVPDRDCNRSSLILADLLSKISQRSKRRK